MAAPAVRGALIATDCEISRKQATARVDHLCSCRIVPQECRNGGFRLECPSLYTRTVRVNLWVPIVQDFVPGMLVRNPAEPDWGLGQVQSAIGPRVTVNFEHAGKLLVNIDKVELEVVVDPSA